MDKIIASKKFKVFFIWLIFLFLVFSSFSQTLATEPQSPQPSEKPPALKQLEEVKKEAGGAIIEYPDPILTIVRTLNHLLTFIGVFFILIIIYGGLLWMTGFEPHEFTFGHEEQVKKGKKIIKQAILGLVIVILAKVLYFFITERFEEVEYPTPR